MSGPGHGNMTGAVARARIAELEAEADRLRAAIREAERLLNEQWRRGGSLPARVEAALDALCAAFDEGEQT